VFASAAGMDKEYTKILLAAAGLDVGSYVVVRRGRPWSALDAQVLGLPVFVKPARAGSSAGITKVTDWSDLDGALDTARRVDPKVLVEAALIGRELECGVLEGPDGRPEASLPGEVVLSDAHDWYDFEAKYLEESPFRVPADLPESLVAEVREVACRAFEALDCAGLARVDFFLAGGSLIVNEVNTMPGFTPTSAFPKMWEATGVPYPALLDRLIAAALRRGTGLR
jgi:D-alanine-D-alanine ligase